MVQQNLYLNHDSIYRVVLKWNLVGAIRLEGHRYINWTNIFFSWNSKDKALHVVTWGKTMTSPLLCQYVNLLECFSPSGVTVHFSYIPRRPTCVCFTLDHNEVPLWEWRVSDRFHCDCLHLYHWSLRRYIHFLHARSSYWDTRYSDCVRVCVGAGREILTWDTGGSSAPQYWLLTW